MLSIIYEQILESKQINKKKFAVLIDPDKIRLDKIPHVLENAIKYHVDFFFIGGSLVLNDKADEVIQLIRKYCSIPLILFPGNLYQLNEKADAILFLSLISGRNPELLIGKHVIAAPFLKASSLEVIPTGYLLIDGGVATSVSYISNTTPIPAEKNDIATSTALAGELLGLKMLFLDAGSGAHRPVSDQMIKAVNEACSIPLIVGGGIKDTEKIRSVLEAGADVVVIGDILEKKPELIREFSEVFKRFNLELSK